MTISLSCANNKSPMALLITILINSVLITYLAFKCNMDPWAGILILMVFVSGVMVLFMYIVSLTPAKVEKMGKKKALLAMMTGMFAFTTWSNSFTPLKEMNKFTEAFSKQLYALAILTTLLIMMASIIPNISMISFKGLKASN